MPVVVTGAAGFIGQHVVAALLGQGRDVVGVDRRWCPDRPRYRHLTSELCDRADHVLTALWEAEAVVHLAGRPGVRDRAPDVEQARWRDNVLAGEVVLAATPPDTPVVAASSSSVYGGAQRSAGRWLACHEDQPLWPQGGYARTKAAFEHRCAARRARGGHVAVVRPFTVAGEGQRPDMALSTWSHQARRGRPMTVLGGTSRRRDVTDVRDVARGVLELLRAGHATTVNLGTGRTHTLHEMTVAVAAHLGLPHRVEVLDADPVEVAATRADTRRCRSLLGFVPATDLSDLVRRQVAVDHHPLPIPEPV